MGHRNTTTPASSGPSPEGDPNVTSPEDFSRTGQAQSPTDSRDGSPDAGTPPSDSNAKSQAPMQKRRRVTRACDECRRKKIKCDGKQPCTHCTVYSYDCTYDQPSNRRRNPAPQYIEALEQRLQKTEAILRSVLPGVDLDDPKFDARGVDQIVESSKAVTATKKEAAPAIKPDDEGQIQPMVDRVGSLDLDDQGNWDFHGHSSGFAFMRRFRAQFGQQFLPYPSAASKVRGVQLLLESPKSSQSSPYELNLSAAVDLPPKEVAIELCRNTIDDCCALMRPIHRPTFFRRLHSIYDTDPEQYNNDQLKFLPLLYVVMGVGCLFSKTENENTLLDMKGYGEAIEQGYQYFNAGKQMLDITDCRDLITIQTIFFMILFLQSSAKLATCYAYIGIALRACCRLGLHRNLPHKFNPIELEERKRIFWLIRKIDTYVGAMLGLPQMLSEDDIDQELPAEVHDDYITLESIQHVPTGVFPLIKASNAHTKLTFILRKVVRYIYPIKGAANVLSGDKYTISHGRIRELERDLQQWMDELPMELKPAENAGMELSRVQQLLRISYAHVQMMMYRPFIHYVSQASQQGKADKRSFACAAACVSVARNIVHITSEMKKRGLLVGAYWFVMYTTFFAIVSLVYFVLENPNSPTGKDILKDALEGRETLASLAKKSMAADRCSESLATLFDALPEKLKERRSSIQPSPAGKKRPAPKTESGQLSSNQSTPNIAAPSREKSMTPGRARTLPHDYLAKIAKRNSMPDPTPSFPMPDASSPPTNGQLLGLNSPAIASPLSQQFEFTPQMGHAQIPDLKNVMFPSDNPFAYPNQPISTLESTNSQFGFQDPSVESYPGSNEASMLGTPARLPCSMSRANNDQQHQFDMTNLQGMYEDNPRLALQFAQQGRHFSAPMTGFGGQVSNMGGPSAMFDMQGPMSQEEYWTQMAKGNIGTRTGFTPGARVNLDELFGGDGWGGMWEHQALPRS